MGLFHEALFAFRARRFTEWFFMNRPQLPIICGITFYGFLYLTFKYDLIARWKGQPTYNDYSYVKQAVERERARRKALSSSSTPNNSPSSST